MKCNSSFLEVPKDTCDYFDIIKKKLEILVKDVKNIVINITSQNASEYYKSAIIFVLPTM